MSPCACVHTHIYNCMYVHRVEGYIDKFRPPGDFCFATKPHAHKRFSFFFSVRRIAAGARWQTCDFVPTLQQACKMLWPKMGLCKTFLLSFKCLHHNLTHMGRCHMGRCHMRCYRLISGLGRFWTMHQMPWIWPLLPLASVRKMSNQLLYSINLQ